MVVLNKIYTRTGDKGDTACPTAAAWPSTTPASKRTAPSTN